MRRQLLMSAVPPYEINEVGAASDALDKRDKRGERREWTNVRSEGAEREPARVENGGGEAKSGESGVDSPRWSKRWSTGIGRGEGAGDDRALVEEARGVVVNEVNRKKK